MLLPRLKSKVSARYILMKKKRMIFAAGAVALLFAVTSTKPVDSQNYPKITVNLNFPHQKEL